MTVREAKGGKKGAKPHRVRSLTRARKLAAQKQAFLDGLARGLSVGGAAAAVPVARRTPYAWATADAEFERRWSEAEDVGTDLLKDEARRRAVDGVERPVYQGGKQVGTVREYSDRLLEVMLRSRDPAFRAGGLQLNVQQNNVTTSTVEPLPTDPQARALELARGIAWLDSLKRRREDGDVVAVQPAALPAPEPESVPMFKPTGAEPVLVVVAEEPQQNATETDLEAQRIADADEAQQRDERKFEHEIAMQQRQDSNSAAQFAPRTERRRYPFTAPMRPRRTWRGR